jgi:hypothetical protein
MLSGKVIVAGVAALVLVAGAGGYGGYRVWRHIAATAPRPAPSAAAVIRAAPTPAPTATAVATPAPTPLPTSVLIKVPYTSQFPIGKFDGYYQDYCEAAALEMVGQYYRGDRRDRIPGAEANAALGQIFAVEHQAYKPMDLPLSVVGDVGSRVFNLQPTVVPVDEGVIRQNLADGRPVIIPVMTHLANGAPISPHYQSKSVYHVVLLTGYDATKDVYTANDAGFVEGQNWQYPWSTLSAVIDLQARQMTQGRVMLVFSPR